MVWNDIFINLKFNIWLNKLRETLAQPNFL